MVNNYSNTIPPYKVNKTFLEIIGLFLMPLLSVGIIGLIGYCMATADTNLSPDRVFIFSVAISYACSLFPRFFRLLRVRWTICIDRQMRIRTDMHEQRARAFEPKKGKRPPLMGIQVYELVFCIIYYLFVAFCLFVFLYGTFGGKEIAVLKLFFDKNFVGHWILGVISSVLFWFSFKLINGKSIIYRKKFFLKNVKTYINKYSADLQNLKINYMGNGEETKIYDVPNDNTFSPFSRVMNAFGWREKELKQHRMQDTFDLLNGDLSDDYKESRKIRYVRTVEARRLGLNKYELMYEMFRSFAAETDDSDSFDPLGTERMNRNIFVNSILKGLLCLIIGLIFAAIGVAVRLDIPMVMDILKDTIFPTFGITSVSDKFYLIFSISFIASGTVLLLAALSWISRYVTVSARTKFWQYQAKACILEAENKQKRGV